MIAVLSSFVKKKSPFLTEMEIIKAKTKKSGSFKWLDQASLF